MFKVGDRVRVVKEFCQNKTCLQKIGTIANIANKSFGVYDVEFDFAFPMAHNGSNGRCKDGYTWTYTGDCLELVNGFEVDLL